MKKKSGVWSTAYISFCYAKKPLTSPMKLNTDSGEITSAHSMAWAGMGWRNMGWSGMGCLPHFCRLIGVEHVVLCIHTGIVIGGYHTHPSNLLFVRLLHPW